MSEKLSKKELESVNGGEYVDIYSCYEFYWSCPEDNIYNQKETESGFDWSQPAKNAMNARKNQIKNEHAGKTVTFSGENVYSRSIVRPDRC